MPNIERLGNPPSFSISPIPTLKILEPPYMRAEYRVTLYRRAHCTHAVLIRGFVSIALLAAAAAGANRLCPPPKGDFIVA
jgi:hypothetical protein